MIDSSTTQPVVSVVIPAYGLPDYLNEAVESVCRQTFTDYEMIVVDDGSPEGVVERYGLPDKLKRQVEALEQSPDAALAFCHYTVVDENLVPLPDQRPPRRSVRNPLKKLISGCFIRTPSTVMVRRDVIEECGLFDEGIVGASDRDLYLRIARRHGFVVVPMALVLYRMHPRQLHKNEKLMRTAKFKIMEKALVWAASEPKSVRNAVRRHYCRIPRQAAKSQMASGDWGASRFFSDAGLNIYNCSPISRLPYEVIRYSDDLADTVSAGVEIVG